MNDNELVTELLCHDRLEDVIIINVVAAKFYEGGSGIQNPADNEFVLTVAYRPDGSNPWDRPLVTSRVTVQDMTGAMWRLMHELDSMCLFSHGMGSMGNPHRDRFRFFIHEWRLLPKPPVVNANKRRNVLT